jgi:two-component system CheB/CheR fusion protein
LEKRVARQYALGARLKKAIDEKRIDVFYQPILDLNSEKVVKLEALARWTEDGEMISPFEFIPIAEKLGYIFQLGEIILEKSCQDLKKLKALGHDNISISINRSIDELSEEDQANCSILNIIRNSGLSEKDIIIEVTESIPLEDKPHVQELLRILRSKGVKVALDDFGTGYASFSNLMKNSIDILKIDRSFVKDISTNQNNAVLIKSVNLLADQLGLDVIAEGVEDYQQLNLLQELGCRYIQGYLISKPQPFDDIVLEVERINKT